jgi:glutathione S-transferase
MSQVTLAINSRNYGAWSLRGWLMCRFAGLDFEERVLDSDDPGTRAELLLLSPSFLVPSLEIDGIDVWDTLAIGEYLWETIPNSCLLPRDRADRARCRSVCAEMHAGFAQLRAALPMNVKARHPGFKVFSGAQADIDRIVDIWRHCLSSSGGPLLFGDVPTMADAMYAPVCTRFVTYDVDLPDDCRAYLDAIMSLKEMTEWLAAARDEPDVLAGLDVEVEF